VLEELIHYLVDLPTPTTAPLYLAVNSGAFLTAHDSQIGVIPVLDTMPTDVSQTISYVRLYDTGRRAAYDRSIGGSNGSYTEYQYLGIEYACQGNSKYQASSRAGDLRRAIETKLRALKGAGVAAGSLTRYDPNGSGHYDKIINWELANSNNNERPPTRVGDLNSTKFTTTKSSVLEVVVTHH
jgi:hypothetical protein